MGGPGSGGYHGGGRPKIYDAIVKTQINLTPQTRDKLLALASALKLNKSEVIRRLIESATVAEKKG